MHTVRLLLAATEYDKQIIDKRFRALSHIHNILVSHAKKRLFCLGRHSEYQDLKSEYAAILKKGKRTPDDKKRKTELSCRMKAIRQSMGLSEYVFQAYIKVCARRYRKCLSSQQVQKEATRVWRGVESVLFKTSNDIHFKPCHMFSTIGGKTNTNGVKFDKDMLSIEWLGLSIPCRKQKDMSYLSESLDHPISYCEIKRLMFPNGWHYYVIVYLKGDPPFKRRRRSKPGAIMGIDIGPSTVAAVSDTEMVLAELAPDAKNYDTSIKRLSQSMDRSKRKTNPDHYHPDGTVKKNTKDRWVYSNNYKKKQNRLKSLYRQKSAYIKQSHEILCNRLLNDSIVFVVEDMNFQALQKRTKQTERQDEPEMVKGKLVYKYKRKRRFGASIGNHAPARFLTILEQKCKQAGGRLIKVNTQAFKASQYDHVTDGYKKAELKERWKEIGGHWVQRDLYSAFLLKNTNAKGTKADRESCICGFETFLSLQEQQIKQMKENGITKKSCFGF